MKYFMDIDILHDKLFSISKYCPMSNSNVNTVVTDINIVESLKNDILTYPSLSQVPNCKSFFQLDHDQNGFQQEEVKFQITIQSNE